jgi:hypothetical protein
MAKKKKNGLARRGVRRASVVVRRAAGGLRRRAAKHGRKPAKQEFIGAAMSAGAGAAFALVDARKPEYSTVKGVPLPLAYGVLAVLAGTMVRATSGGMVGQVLRETGSAGLALGTYKLLSAKLGNAVEGDDSDDAVEGDFEDDNG